MSQLECYGSLEVNYIMKTMKQICLHSELNINIIYCLIMAKQIERSGMHQRVRIIPEHGSFTNL